MADLDITQAEADALIEMEKRFVNDENWTFPAPGQRVALDLTSLDKRENFVLDVTRAQIKLTKATFQNRVRQAIVLMRLDLDGPPHRNPDGEDIPCPHLHVYSGEAKVSIERNGPNGTFAGAGKGLATNGPLLPR